MVSLLVLLWGCGNVQGVDGENGPVGEDGEPLPDPSDPASLSIDVPSAASYLPSGSTEVSGKVVNIESVTVNGAPATVSGGSFSANQSLVTGMNIFDVRGLDAEGNEVRDLRSALAGEFAAPDGMVGSALQVHLGAAELDAIGPLVGEMLDPTMFSDQITAMNPVVDDGSMLANVTGVEFDAPIVTAIPVDGALDLVVSLPNFRVPLTVETTVLFFPVTLDGALLMDEVLIYTSLELGTDGAGGLDLALVDTSLEMVNFEIDIDGLADFIEDSFMSDEDAELLVAGELDGLVDSIPTLLDDALAGMDELGVIEAELMGQTLALEPYFSAAGINAQGLYLGADLAVDVSGSSATGAGHLYQQAPDRIEGEGLTVQIADDFMNRFLHELWGAGAIDIDLPIDAGGLESALLLMFGGQQGEAGSLSIRAALPPTWIGRGDENRLQLPELTMTVETPGGDYGDVVELAMMVDAKAEFALTDTGAGIVLSDADIKLHPLGEGEAIEELRAKVPELETAMGIGIGMLNDMLSFPVEGLEGLELPEEFGLIRDPSNKGQMLQFALEDLAGLLEPQPEEPEDPTAPPEDQVDPNTDPTDPPEDPVDPPEDPVDPPEDPVEDPTDPPTPPTPEPMEVQVPSDAMVYDFDGTSDIDGDIGWVCRNDDIEVTGNDGTWYVDNRGEVVVTGTGHMIYAYDNADVILESAGNTVYADVGATVEDQDGTNTIIWVDPMSFDTSVAPSDGC